MDIYRTAVSELQQMRTNGAGRQQLLSHLTHVAENAAGEGSICSILLLDDNGLLRNGASPGLPADYLQAIDGLRPDAKVGTCAAAAATGAIVLTPDFSADDKWAELKHLPQALGFKGAWSMPVKTQDGRVLGTFGTYYRQRRTPSDNEMLGVKLLAEAVAEIVS